MRSVALFGTLEIMARKSWQIAVKTGIDNNIGNTRNITAQAKHLKRRKGQRNSSLTEEHKMVQMAFIEIHLHWKKKWCHVIFKDEKKFELDRPESFACHFSRKKNFKHKMASWFGQPEDTTNSKKFSF